MNRNCIVVLLTMFVSLCVCSCKNAGTDNGKENTDPNAQEQKIVYNDKIQNVFFGVPLGATKEEVIEGFAKQDFYENGYSTDSRLCFYKKTDRYGSRKDYFSFGDINWKFLDVNLCNNRFQSIEFSKPFKNKEAAIESFDDILSTVSKKYHMFEDPIEDTTSYKRYVGATESNQWIVLHCYSYESVSHDKYISVTLAYGDNNFVEISDEL